MKNLITYFIKNPIAANLLMIGIFILGVFGLQSMKTTFFPEEDERFIAINTTYMGASPEEIEEGVVTKIEEQLKGVSGIERVTSTSTENAGLVTVEILKGYDIDLVLQDVNNAVDGINSFPVGIEPPIIFKRESLGFAISFSLSGNVDLRTLKRYAQNTEEALLAMEGISKVSLSGFPEEEIEIAFRESDLRAYQLTFAQATRAIQAANLELSGGTVKGTSEELLLRAKNKKYYAADLEDIVVKTAPNGSLVRLRQIADIRDKWADTPNRSFLDKESGVIISLQNTLSEDMISIVDKVRDFVEKFNAENDIVKATVVRDESIALRQRMDLLTENGTMGFLLVVLFLAMFLNWRLAMWVAIAIPISFAGMFICASMVGDSINVISLFGMIMVLGILVDDGIVISESIYQHYERGVPRFQAAVEGTLEVFPAVFAAVLTTILAFAGFYFIDGQMGDFFSAIATVVIFSLVFSLIEGAFILPAHVAHSKALSPNKKKYKVTEKLDAFMVWLRDKVYAPALRFSIHNQLLTFACIFGLFLITVGCIRGGIIPATFFPDVEINNIDVDLKMPAGTTETITQKWLDHIENAALEVNKEFRDLYFGGEKDPILMIQKDLGPTTNQGKLSLVLLDIEERDSINMRKISDAIRQKAGPIPGAESLTYGSFLGFGKPISISLVGQDYEQLQGATNELKTALSNYSELRDVIDDNQKGVREINIKLKEKAHFLGISLQEVIGQVRQGFFGSEVQRLQRGRDEVKVWVRYAEEERTNISKLENMRIRFLDGREFPLTELADLEIKRGVISINHLNGEREVKIEADVSHGEVEVPAITDNIRESLLPPLLAKYSGVTALLEGQNREQEKSNKSMALVYPIVLLLMFFAIALAFRSISQTVVVFLLIPFCYIGVGWGHYFMGHHISMLSNLGTLALIGILVNDALVFVTTYNQNLTRGMEQMDALYKAGLSRFRPIVLTSATTIVGLVPLLLDKSFQAQFLIPMAISVAFGLMFITVIILVLLPVFLILANRFKVMASWAWNGVKPSYEAVETATAEEGGYNYGWYLLLAILILLVVLKAFEGNISSLLS